MQVSTLDLFKTILEEQKSLPRDQPYKDLVNLMNFLVRKFFKAVAEDPFLIVEVSCPLDICFVIEAEPSTGILPQNTR